MRDSRQRCAQQILRHISSKFLVQPYCIFCSFRLNSKQLSVIPRFGMVRMFQNAHYIGVDPLGGTKPFVFIVLDDQLSLVQKGWADLSDTLTHIGNYPNCIVAVCSPYQPNQRLLENEAIRSTVSPPLKPGRWLNYRLCEVILRKHRIKIIPTPDQEHACPRWMQKGFQFYRKLQQMGFRRFPTENASHQFIETYPHAAFTILLGHHPLPKQTLEGRLQRQLLLYERNIQLPDPMRFFEEVTRYKVLQGNFPKHLVLLPNELDATIAAYCAWLAKHDPSSVSLIGDPEEGQILIPTNQMKSRY